MSENKDLKTIDELIPLIQEWGRKKKLKDPDKQYLKVLEEVGETAKAVLTNDRDEIIDGLGDIAITVIIYYWQKKAPLKADFSEGNAFNDLSIMFQIMIEKIYATDMFIFGWMELIAKSKGTTLQECLNAAWNEIKDRKGNTVNGTFIKE